MNAQSIDLIYLDPPFNSNRNYAAPVGSKAAGAAFKDAWTLQDVDIAWVKQIKTHYPKVAAIIESAGAVGGKGDQSYLTYMAVRLLELHRVLKDTGSLYLHCDTKMSHSLKLLLDGIFRKKNFNNEIIWCYSTSGRAGRGKRNRWAQKHDTILCYAKNIKKFKADCTIPVSDEYLKSHYKQVDDQGRQCRIRTDAGKRRIYYPDEGMNGNDWWVDIPYVNSQADNRLYITQKPSALLERIIEASSNKGDIVLDPFCGCATTCIAAEKLLRQWIGIDISEKAVELVKLRLYNELAIGNVDNPTLFEEVIHRTDIPVRDDQLKLSKNIKEILYGKQEGNCNGCGAHFEMRHFDIDHIVPVSKGGPNVDDNLQLLCGHCNSVKGNRTMEYLVAKLEAQR